MSKHEKIIGVFILAALAAGPALVAADKPLLAQHPSLSRTADRVRLCGRPLARAPRRRSGHAADGRRRDRERSRVLARRRDDRFLRPVRRQHRRLRRSGRGRRPAPADLSPQPRRSRRLDARRQAHHLPVGAVERLRHPDALHGRPRRRLPRGAPSPDGRSGLLLAPTGRAWPTCRPCSGRRPGNATRAARRRRSGSSRLADLEVEKIPRDNSNDSNPMWVGDKIYFLSDRKGPVSLFVYDLDDEEGRPGPPERRPRFQVGLGRPGGIVVEQFGALHLFDLPQGRPARYPSPSRATCPRFGRVTSRSEAASPRPRSRRTGPELSSRLAARS